MSKCKIELIGQDGNIFNLVGLTAKSLRKAGYVDEAKEMTTKVFESESYDAALMVIMDYVEVE